MKQDEHVDVYRAAFESASSELAEILGEFERLLSRKDQVEKLVKVLKPLVSVDEQVAVAESNPDTITPEGQAAETPMASSEETMERGPDPFQRRIDHVLGIGAGIRDVRKYSRQF
jgi:hypothetical protein